MAEHTGDPDSQVESTTDASNLFDDMDAEDQSLARALLDEGNAFRELAGDRGSTPLHIAAEREKEKVVKFLLFRKPVKEHPKLLQKADHEGDTPHHIAAGNFQIFKLMSQANPDISGVLNTNRQNLLHYAAGKNNPEVVDFLLKVDRGLKSARDHTGATPFHFGARSGIPPDVMGELMNENDVDETNNDGLTALHYAARNGHMEVVLWLLKKGASVSRVDLKKKNTALHWAAVNKSPESSKAICLALIEKAADVLFLRNVDGKLPVDLAYDLHNNEAVKIICKAMITSRVLGKFDHMAGQDNGTLLHYVAAYGTEEDVKLVLAQIFSDTPRGRNGKEENYKENVNKVDSKGQNAFHWAARAGNTEVIQVLKSNSVDPLLEANNITPLCRAIIGEYVNFAEMLLGESITLTAEDWTTMVNIWIDQVQYVFDQRILQQIKREIENVDPQKLRNLTEEAVLAELLAELPPIYKALCAGKQEIAKFIQKQSKGVFEFVNSKGKITGMSALHWAIILKQKRIVSLLCNTKELSDDLVADVVNVHSKTPLEYSTDMEIMTELKRRDEVKYYVEGLYRDRQVYVDISNAVLQGAAITAGITFEKWLYRPHDDNEREILCWICNNLAFFCAIATVFAGTCTMSVPNSDITKAVTSIRKALILAVVLLGMSIYFVVTASIVALLEPPSFPGKYADLPSYMMWSLFVGLGVCSYFTYAFARQVSPKDVPSHTYFSVFSAMIFPYITTAAFYALPPLSFEYRLYMMSMICLTVVLSLLFAFLRGRPSLISPTTATTTTEGGQARASGPVEPAYYTLGKRHAYIPWDDGLDHLKSLPLPEAPV